MSLEHDDDISKDTRISTCAVGNALISLLSGSLFGLCALLLLDNKCAMMLAVAIGIALTAQREDAEICWGACDRAAEKRLLRLCIDLILLFAVQYLFIQRVFDMRSFAGPFFSSASMVCIYQIVERSASRCRRSSRIIVAKEMSNV